MTYDKIVETVDFLLKKEGYMSAGRVSWDLHNLAVTYFINESVGPDVDFVRNQLLHLTKPGSIGNDND